MADDPGGVPAAGIDTPTLCYLENLTPVNVCRVCVVEVEGSRTLVPACSRRVEPGMEIRTDSPRVRTSRKMVLEFLGSSVDLSLAPPDVQRWLAEYGVRPRALRPARARPPAGERDARGRAIIIRPVTGRPPRRSPSR